MFDWMLSENHAIAILKKNHDTVKSLFDEFEEGGCYTLHQGKDRR